MKEKEKTILSDHQSAYLPWLGLFHKIALSDIYVYLDNVQYLAREFNNRNKIKSSGGAIWLTVPVLKGSQHKKIKEIEIDNSENWSGKHWKAIYLNYKKAPYFSSYSDFFEEVYKRKWQYLTDLNEYMLKWFLKELGIKVEYWRASELNLQGSKSDLMLALSKKLGASLHIFGLMGRNYIKEEDFNKEDIKVYFQDYHHPQYRQLWGDFVPQMSIIDLLFNHGDKSLDILMSNNMSKEELIKKIIYGQ